MNSNYTRITAGDSKTLIQKHLLPQFECHTSPWMYSFTLQIKLQDTEHANKLFQTTSISFCCVWSP